MAQNPTNVGNAIEIREQGPNAKAIAKFLAKHPDAKEHFDHFQTSGLLATTFRRGAQDQINELENSRIPIFEEIRHAEKKARESINGPDGKPKFDDADLIAARQKLADAETMIAAAKAGRDGYPASQLPTLQDWITVNLNRELISVPMAEHAPDEKISSLTAKVQAEQKELRAIQHANKTDDEVAANIRNIFHNMKRSPLSRLNFDSILAGGSLTRDGEFSMANDPKIQIPYEQYFADFDLTDAEGRKVSGVIHSLAPDALALLVAVDHDDSFLNRVIATAQAMNKGQRQIAMADKMGMIVAQKDKLLIAERRLEFGYRRTEAAGKRIGRPREWSPMVMLWLGRKPATVSQFG
jgi:hypothetical protein